MHLGEASDIDVEMKEALVRALNTDPAFLDATWDAWVEPMILLYGWSEERISDAKVWLDVEFLGGLANP